MTPCGSRPRCQGSPAAGPCGERPARLPARASSRQAEMAVNLVNLENVRKAHGTTVVLDDVSLGVADGERIGVVGRNGSGKSTLLRVLAGDESVDTGRVTHTGGLTVGRLAQRDQLPDGASVSDAV